MTPSSRNPPVTPRSDRWWCYRYVGAAVPDWQRRDLTLATPPTLVKDWPRKPRTLLAATCAQPDDAIGWLAGQVDEFARLMRPHDPQRHARLLGYLDHRRAPHLDWVARCRHGWCDALCQVGHHHRVYTGQHYLGGSRIVVWAVVPNRAVELSR